MMQRTRSLTWGDVLLTLALLATMSLLTGCWGERPVVYVTGQDYIRLEKGQTYTAPRDMTLATESVVQEKDETILDLLQANAALEAENRHLKGQP